MTQDISKNNLPQRFDAQITKSSIRKRTRTPQNGIRVLCYQENKKKYLVLFIIPVVLDISEAVFPSEYLHFQRNPGDNQLE